MKALTDPAWSTGMVVSRTIERPGAAIAADVGSEEDMRMLGVAARIARDLSMPRASIYWPDLLLSVALGYAALAGAVLLDQIVPALLCGLVAILALYRAASFIHELSHLREGALPGFRFAWNALVGVPLLIPSFLYEGVHTRHHARTRYGTAGDPEYLPLAAVNPWSLPLFVLGAVLVPLALLVRFAMLTPLGWVLPPLRRYVRERYSALAINPAYRRQAPTGAFRRRWLVQEGCACLWALLLLASVAVTGPRPLITYLLVHAGFTVINQLRTLVAHLWDNDGRVMSLTAQYLDSVNVPPPNRLAAIWAPVGLRYHALHHLLPSLPYHALGEAHRRIMAELGADSTYGNASYAGMYPLIGKIARSTLRVGWVPRNGP